MKKRKVVSFCFICSDAIDSDLVECSQCCKSPVHASCASDKYVCESCTRNDVICVTCDAVCTCNQSLEEPEFIDIESNSSDNEILELESQEEVDDLEEQELDSDSEGESSIYEEPDDLNSDEEVMVEIVRDRIINGWEDSDFEDEFDSSDQEDEEELLKAETLAIQRQIEPKALSIPNIPKTPPSVIIVENSVIEPAFKPNVILESKSVEIPQVVEKTIFVKTPSNSNSLPSKPPSKSSKHQQSIPSNIKKPIAKETAMTPTPIPKSAIIKQKTTPGGVASPAAIKAFNELRKKEMDKIMESLNLQAKLKAGQPNLPTKVNTKDLRKQITAQEILKATKESSKKSLVQDKEKVDESSALFEDIFDHGRFEESSVASEEVPAPIIKKIVFGHYFKRNRPQKRSDFQRYIKKSSDLKALENTLLESVPERPKKKTILNLFSPILYASIPTVPVDPSQSLEFLDDSHELPPPFEL